MKNTIEQIQQLGPWFHNIHLPDGTQTAPEHFLGDFPSFKWQELSPFIPTNLEGLKILDIGCNAGFYSIELAKRGAQVVAMDLDPQYLRQAEWVIQQFGLQDRIQVEHKQIYDLAAEEESYDIIWFMGVLYHLRYPMLALDIITQKVKKWLVLQTLTMPLQDPSHQLIIKNDYSINDRQDLLHDGWPKMAFIENSFQKDPTNWWFPNTPCVEAMLRSCGMKVQERPGAETYIFAPDPEKGNVAATWNRSEYLAATRKDWKKELNHKVGHRP